MNSTAAGWLQFLLLFAALAACYVPLGNWIAHIFTDKKHWRIERGIYKLTGIDPDADMRWTVYVRSILASSLVAVLFVYLIERTQHWLFWSIGMANVPTDTAWNTAVSFTTNTNWQNYAGEATMGYLTQQSALMVQQFFSAAVGLAVAIAMIRGFTRSRTDRLGNFWVDVTRGIIRLLIPLAVIGCLVLVASGGIETISAARSSSRTTGSSGALVRRMKEAQPRSPRTRFASRIPVRSENPSSTADSASTTKSITGDRTGAGFRILCRPS